jgi:glycosyltransferase domain-containing protein
MNNITLIILTHNRHEYLKRSLDYYSTFNIPIIIADSSAVSFNYNIESDFIKYYHLNTYTFLEKIIFSLGKVLSDFVLMSADDDFTFQSSVIQCVNFLCNNPDYVAASGKHFAYYKSSIKEKDLVLANLNNNYVKYDINSNYPQERIKEIFSNYRTMFYAVHRTKILKHSFDTIKRAVTNLFLIEYTSVILPLIKGKYKELDIPFQLREFTFDSGDKSVDNLDVLFTKPDAIKEIKDYIKVVSDFLSENSDLGIEQSYSMIEKTLLSYKDNIINNKNKPESKEKKIGRIIQRIPYIGLKIITNYRKNKLKIVSNKIFNSYSNFRELSLVRDLIKKYKELN